MSTAKTQILDTPSETSDEAAGAEPGALEIAGRAEAPPPAHGAGAAPGAPSWSYPSGIVAGRDTPASRRAHEYVPTASSHGPAGKRRSRLAVIGLSVMTLGVYALVWHKRINTEVADFDPHMHVRAGRSTIAVTIAWLLGLLVSMAGAARIVLDAMKITPPFDPHFTVTQGYFLLGGLLVIPYLVLALPFSSVAVAMTLERVRMAEDRAGKTADVQIRPVQTMCLLFVPIIGGLTLISHVQRRLNQIWEIASPPARISTF
jgi:Domain of unknown function (DUF4234)